MDECECGDEDCAAVGYCVNSELDLYRARGDAVEPGGLPMSRLTDARWREVFALAEPLAIQYDDGTACGTIEWSGTQCHVTRPDGTEIRARDLDGGEMVQTVVRTAVAQGDPSGVLEWLWPRLEDEAEMVLRVAQGFVPGAVHVAETSWSTPDAVAYYVHGPDGELAGTVRTTAPGEWAFTERQR